jgi:hypothetical protein
MGGALSSDADVLFPQAVYILHQVLTDHSAFEPHRWVHVTSIGSSSCFTTIAGLAAVFPV